MYKNTDKRQLFAAFVGVLLMMTACGGRPNTAASSGSQNANATNLSGPSTGGSSTAAACVAPGGPAASCGPSSAGLYAFYRLEPVNCNADSCPAPALAARVVVSDDPNFCADGAGKSTFTLDFPPLSAVNVDGNTLLSADNASGQPVVGRYADTFAATGSFNDTQVADPYGQPPGNDSHGDLGNQPFATPYNAPFATYTAGGKSVGTDFTKDQKLTFTYDGNNVTNLEYAVSYPAGSNVTDSKALQGALPQATACPQLDPNVPSDATLASEYDVSTMTYFFYYVSQYQYCLNSNYCRQIYTPSAVLTDRADFCDLVSNGSDVSNIRYLTFGLDSAQGGPSTISPGTSAVGNSTTSLGANSVLNVPGMGYLTWDGFYSVNLSTPDNTLSLLNYQIIVDRQYPFTARDGAPAHSQLCPKLGGK